MARLVFIDSGVLIAAARGSGEVSARALEELDDPEATFASSIFVQLEVLPKATFNKKDPEVRFYQKFFAGVTSWAEPDRRLAEMALDQACQCGMSARDALHVAAAVSMGAAEVVTSEKPGTSLHRTKVVRVRSIYPGASK